MTAPSNPRLTDSPFNQVGDDGKVIPGSFPVCGAVTHAGSADERRCPRPAGMGTPHPGRGPCKLHFGCTPMVVDKYILEEALERATLVGEHFQGHSVDIGPHEALLEEVRRTAGKVRYLNNLCDYGKFDSPVDAAQSKRDLLNERRHLVAACATAARAGVEERAIKLAETWGHEIALLFQAVFADLRLSAEQKEQAPEIVERHLKLLESG